MNLAFIEASKGYFYNSNLENQSLHMNNFDLNQENLVDLENIDINEQQIVNLYVSLLAWYLSKTYVCAFIFDI